MAGTATSPEEASPRWLWTDRVARTAAAPALGGLGPVEMRAALEAAMASARKEVTTGVGIDVLLRVWFDLPLELPAANAPTPPGGSSVRLLLGAAARNALDDLDRAAVAGNIEQGRAAILTLSADSSWELGLGRDTVLAALAECLPVDKPTGYLRPWAPARWGTRAAWLHGGPAEIALRYPDATTAFLERWRRGPGQAVDDANCQTGFDRKLYGVVRKAMCVQAKAHVARMERAMDGAFLAWSEHA